MAVLAPAEFTAVVAEHGGDLGVVGLEEGPHVIVEHANGRDRQRIRVETPPGIAAEAVDDGPQVHLADAFESTHEECVYGHQITGVALPVTAAGMPLISTVAEPAAMARGRGGCLGLEWGGENPLYPRCHHGYWATQWYPRQDSNLLPSP